VFTARYALTPYIKQIHFVFKGLIEVTLLVTGLSLQHCTADKMFPSFIRVKPWSLTVAHENALRSFEIKMLRKIFGPVWDRGKWRIRYNAESNELTEGHDIVRFGKAQRIRWLGHVERMSEERMPKRMLKGKLFYGRRKGPAHTRWLDNVVMAVRGWRGRIVDAVGWSRVVNEVKVHQGLQCCCCCCC
jgi:hypothetical protein